MTSQPLKFHGGKSGLASWIQSLAPPSVNADPINGYTHRGILCAGGLGEFWNWECNGISEVVNDSNELLMNFYAVLSNDATRQEFISRAALVPLAESAFNAACIVLEDRPESLDRISLALAFFIKYRQSRQGLGRDYCTPTKRTRGGMNENVSAWLSAVDGLAECAERLLRVELRCLDFRQMIVKYDHKRMLWYIDPPYWGPERTSFGEYGEYGEYEFQPWDHAAGRVDGRDLPYVPMLMTGGMIYSPFNLKHALSNDCPRMGLLDILPLIGGRFMLSGYHSVLYDSWAERYKFKCFEHAQPNSAASSAHSNGVKSDRVECVWTNY